MSFRVRDTSTIAFKEVEPRKEVTKKSRKKSRKKEKENETVNNVPQSGGLRVKPDFTSLSDYF
jgi:hypothetical protein